jgi:hypothetical protein
MLWKISYFTLFLMANCYLVSSLVQFVSPLLLYPFTAAAIETLTWKIDKSFLETWLQKVWSRAKLQLIALLVLFHWYIVPFVYQFERRGEWWVEIQLLFLVFAVQIAFSGFTIFLLMRWEVWLHKRKAFSQEERKAWR